MLTRLEEHIYVSRVEPHRFGRELRPAHLRDDAIHLGEAHQRLLDLLRDDHPLWERCAWQAPRLDEQRSLVELRHELRAQERHRSQRDDQQRERGEDDGTTVFERPAQRREIACPHRLEPAGGLFRPMNEEKRRHHGYICQREQQRAEHGDADGECHRREHPTLEALEREDRQVHRDDDADAEHDRATDLEGRATNGFAAVLALAFRVAEPAHEVLHHHHRGIHDQSEVQRAQAHEVGGVPESLHQHEGEQEGQRNHRRDDQRRAQVAEKHEQDEGDEQSAFDEVPEDGVRRSIHHLALVVERSHDDALRQQRLDVLEARLHQAHDFLAVRTLEHHDHAGEGLASAIVRHGPFTRHGADRHLRDVPDVHGHATGPRAHDDVADVGGITEAPESAHREPFTLGLDVARTEVVVIGVECALEIAQRDAIAGELARIRHHVELLHHAAPGVHVGHARQRAQHRLDRVLLQRLQLHERERVGHDEVLEHLTHRGGGWPERGVHALRERRRRVLHALRHLGAREVEVHRVVVRHRHHGDARLGDGSHAARPRQSHHRCLHRVADEVLHLVGRHSGRDRDDLHLVGGEVRKCVEVDVGERPQAGSDE